MDMASRATEETGTALPCIRFSQTLGPGRGLEDLIAALPLVKRDAEIHLRGNPVSGFENWLAHRLPEDWRNRIVVYPLVTNAELLSRIAEHDVGFAGEPSLIRSRDLTVTNKILYYLLAGLAVLASDTTGQREVADRHKVACSCIHPATPLHWRRALKLFSGQPTP